MCKGFGGEENIKIYFQNIACVARADFCQDKGKLGPL
jgi:hypothetical protein